MTGTSTAVRTTVCIVDDDPGIRNSLEMVMESADLPARLYASATELLADLEANLTHDCCGCILLDLQMPGMTGIELLRRFRELGYDSPVIVVTGTATILSAVESMKLGAVDFLEKPIDHRILLNKIQQALAAHAAKRVEASEVVAIRDRMATLTDRELELVRLVVSGLANKHIADEMGISIKTVANHRANLMAKAGALNAADLVRMSMIAGIV
ncbi:MAG: two-component system, LuxR family, response regulator FixJ [Humisphaera sp.]|nr:two-component system, LuxR family, response regulator FixJ [Humisphaera sp.]